MMKQTAFAAALALMASSNAHAHTTFDTPTAKAGAFHVASLRIFHGCEGAPTVKVTIDIPDGVTRVKPRTKPGWAVSVAMKTLDEPMLLHGEEITETVASVTWEGGALPDFAYDEFTLHMMMPHHAHEGALSFPVHQTCETGKLEWTEKALDEKSFRSLEHPAPFITLE